MNGRVLAGLAMALAVAGGLGGADGARASTITRTFDFTLSGFDSNAPYDPYSGSFTLTWDPTQSYFDATSGIVLNSLTGTVDQGVAFIYLPGTDALYVGGLSFGVLGVAPTTNDFFIEIRGGAGASPELGNTLYTFGSKGGPFHPRDLSLSLAAVPEPASWAVMILGLGGVGAVLRGRRGARRLAA